MSSKQTCRYILLSSQSTEWSGVIKIFFFLQPARNRGARSRGAAKQESSSGEEEESSEEESEDEDGKKKGVAGLIEVENPNRAKKTHKKVSALDDSPASAKPQLSRREREEIEKAKAKANYQKLHAAGKTDEARADLARLAIIRKQREEAAAKRDAEKKAKEDAAKAKADAKKLK